MRTMVKKYSKSMYAKVELDKLVHMMVVTHVPTRWWSDIDMMARVKKIDQKDPSALNKVVDLENASGMKNSNSRGKTGL